MKKILSTFLVFLFLLSAAPLVLAQDCDAVKKAMESRQDDLVGRFDRLNERFDRMPDEDPKKGLLDPMFEEIERVRNRFNDLNIDDQPCPNEDRETAPSAEYTRLELELNDGLNDLNQTLVKPYKPGSKGGTQAGSVPEGDIVQDFIPQVIRLLFRFVYSVIIIVMLVAGIMLIAAQDNEEMTTNAKKAIYYAIIGFAIVTLAFAAVKAITDIDFFDFVYVNEAYAITLDDFDDEVIRPKNLPTLGDTGEPAEAVINRAFEFGANIILYASGSIAVLMLVVAGIMYITAYGNQERMDIAKKLIKYAITGLLVVILAYAIVTNVIDLIYRTAG